MYCLYNKYKDKKPSKMIEYANININYYKIQLYFLIKEYKLINNNFKNEVLKAINYSKRKNVLIYYTTPLFIHFILNLL